MYLLGYKKVPNINLIHLIMKKLIAITILLLGFIALANAADDKHITMDKLPAKAQESLKANFANQTVSFIVEDRDLMGREYDVHFMNGDMVEFDKEGEWKEVNCKHSSVPTAMVPVEIRTHLAANYPGSIIHKIDRRGRDYKVELNNGKEVKFDRQFKMVGENY